MSEVRLSKENRIDPESKASELSEQDLNQVAGGAAAPAPAVEPPVVAAGTVHGSRSNIKNNIVTD